MLGRGEVPGVGPCTLCCCSSPQLLPGQILASLHAPWLCCFTPAPGQICSSEMQWSEPSANSSQATGGGWTLSQDCGDEQVCLLLLFRDLETLFCQPFAGCGKALLHALPVSLQDPHSCPWDQNSSSHAGVLKLIPSRSSIYS